MDFHTCRWVAEKALEVLCPEALTTPVAIDSRLLILDTTILGVTVRHASRPSMGGDEGRYYHDDRTILLRDDHWEALRTSSGEVWRARATLSHEIAHHLLRENEEVTDEEDDAWTVAGCLMMPCAMVQTLERVDDVYCSEVFNVSPQFAFQHLSRMKRARLFG